MITVFQTQQVTPCAMRLEKEARGLFGFHDSRSCPDCRFENIGFVAHAGDSIFAPLVTHGNGEPSEARKFLSARYPMDTVTVASEPVVYIS